MHPTVDTNTSYPGYDSGGAPFPYDPPFPSFMGLKLLLEPLIEWNELNGF